MLKYTRFLAGHCLLIVATLGVLMGGAWMWMGFLTTLVVCIAGDAILGDDLHPLRNPGWKLTAALNLRQSGIDQFGISSSQGFGEKIGGRYRVLHCEINSHSADRRHRMSGIANAEQPVRVPLFQLVDFHG